MLNRWDLNGAIIHTHTHTRLYFFAFTTYLSCFWSWFFLHAWIKSCASLIIFMALSGNKKSIGHILIIKIHHKNDEFHLRLKFFSSSSCSLIQAEEIYKWKWGSRAWGRLVGFLSFHMLFSLLPTDNWTTGTFGIL